MIILESFETFQAIIDNCHNLRAINLSNCKKLPTGSVDNIVSSCKLLQDIDLSSTTVSFKASVRLRFWKKEMKKKLWKKVVSLKANWP